MTFRWLRDRRMAAIAVMIVALIVVGIVIALRAAAFRGQTSAALARASGTLITRPTTGRISGGFPYKPRGEPRRGDGNDDSADSSHLRLAAVAAEIETGNDAHARGVALLITGKYRRAVGALESAVRDEPRNAFAWSDLSAAYLARAEASGFVPDYAAALDASERAYRLKVTPETAWNRALAISAVHLPDADAAWTDELRIDRDEAWRQEAEKRRAALRVPSEAEEWRRIEPRLPQRVAAHDGAAIADAVRRFPAQTLLYLDATILPQWGGAHLRGDSRAAQLREVAQALGERLAAGGERLPLDAVTSIRDACHDAVSCDAIARAYARLADARALSEAQDFRGASEALATAASNFDALHSPHALIARCERAASLVHENRFAEARRSCESLLDAAEQHHYRTLEGRLLWIMGLTTLHDARPEESIDFYRRAKALFLDGGDTANAGAIEFLIGDACQYAGDRDSAIEHLFAALDAIRASGDTKQLAVALFETGDTLAERGWPHAAARVLAEATRAALAGRRFAVAAMSEISRSAAAARECDFDTASDHARMAAAYWQQITDAGQRSLISNMNRLAATASDGKAVGKLTESIDFFEMSGNRAWLPRLLRQRALIHEQNGDLADAERDFRRAIDTSEEILDNAAPAAMRDGFASDVRANYDDLIRLLLGRGVPREALSYAERARRIGHGTNRGTDVLHCVTITPPSRFAAVYELVGHDIVVWLVSRNSVGVFRMPAAEEARTLAAATDDDGAPPEPRREALYDLLVREWISYVPPDSDLVFLPSPELAQVPFPALLSRDSRRPLIDDYTVTIAQSLASLTEGPVKILASDRILVIGDPAYRNVTRLPGTRGEALAVASHYQRRTVFLGQEATNANLFARIGDASIFHFAGHAIVNDLAPELSSLVLASPTGDDSHVYVHELDARRLRMKLVVLSACGTAKRSRTRGTLTIARAFADAGAQTVVATLWPVTDNAAAAFATAFHDALARGDSVPRAARAAQRGLQHGANGDPSWAAFCVLQGNAARTGGMH